ncbi:hypothetical protein [Clostridium lundense]|uniref:hypothetical protein n=1 Tax=Clostridium lundense TaxID=319475 RepID=UPI0006885DD6|nr:hypothetical protein [Clostridium lundense]
MSDNFSSRFGNKLAFEGIGGLNGNSPINNVKLKPTKTQIAYNEAIKETKEAAEKQMKKATGAYNSEFSSAVNGLGKLEGKSINVSEKGLNIVKKHIGTFEEYAPNQAMISRVEEALAKGKPITGADASFYMHELSESTMMSKGMGYNEAHAVAMQKYNVSPFSVYHPNVMDMYPEEFNSTWRNFWR